MANSSPSVAVRLTVNGETREAEVDVRTPLVLFLREQLGLTGTRSRVRSLRSARRGTTFVLSKESPRTAIWITCSRPSGTSLGSSAATAHPG